METYEYCFVTLPPGAAHSYEGSELRDAIYSNACYVLV